MKKAFIWIIIAAASGIGLYSISGGEKPVSSAPITLSKAQVDGAAAFDQNCSVCHGSEGIGTDQGPPLIHIIYEPGHHSDASFHRAVALGVRQHHWRFGDMPAVGGVSEGEVSSIIDYIRALQRAVGIN